MYSYNTCMKTFEYRYKNDMKKNVICKNGKGYPCLGVLFLTIQNKSNSFLVQYNITIKKLKDSLLYKKFKFRSIIIKMANL